MKDVGLVAVWGEFAESCAVEVTVEDVEQDLINGAEELKIDDVSWGTFASISPSISGISKGDSVLYASAAFEEETGATADVTVPDEACAVDFRPKARLDFFGSFGPVAGSTTLPSDFTAHSLWNGTDRVDLSVEGYTLHGLGGAWDIGAGPVPGGGLCGCDMSTSNGWAAAAPLAWLVFAGLRRRPRR